MANLKNTTINDTGFITLPVGNTAQRPASPVDGMMRVNTTTSYLEVYFANTWNSVSALGLGSSPATAVTTGSPTVTTSGGYRIYQFTGSGSITL